MFNELLIGTITPFSGSTTPDKNGKPSVMIQCIAGKMPNRNVLSGTVAERAGLAVGHTYLLNCREQGVDKIFGSDFTFIKLFELTSGADVIEAAGKLGPSMVFKVERPEAFADAYERKGNAVESLRMQRIKSGDYIPSGPTTAADHSSASRVIEGSTTQGYVEQELERIERETQLKKEQDNQGNEGNQG